MQTTHRFRGYSRGPPNGPPLCGTTHQRRQAACPAGKITRGRSEAQPQPARARRPRTSTRSSSRRSSIGSQPGPAISRRGVSRSRPSARLAGVSHPAGAWNPYPTYIPLWGSGCPLCVYVRLDSGHSRGPCAHDRILPYPGSNKRRAALPVSAMAATRMPSAVGTAPSAACEPSIATASRPAPIEATTRTTMPAATARPTLVAASAVATSSAATAHLATARAAIACTAGPTLGQERCVAYQHNARGWRAGGSRDAGRGRARLAARTPIRCSARHCRAGAPLRYFALPLRRCRALLPCPLSLVCRNPGTEEAPARH